MRKEKEMWDVKKNDESVSSLKFGKEQEYQSQPPRDIDRLGYTGIGKKTPKSRS